MNTSQTLKAAVLFALGLGCAAAAFTIEKANAAGHTTVAVSSVTDSAGQSMPVVTVTARKLSMPEKLVLAMRDKAHRAHNG